VPPANIIRVIWLLALVPVCAGCPPKPTVGFSEAVQTGNVAEVESNLFWGKGKFKPTINGPLDKTGRTALHAAAEYGHLELAEYLIRNGAEVNHTGHWGALLKTPLHLAATNGHEDIVRLLLAHGANPDAKDNHSQNPAQCALDSGHPHIATLILQTRTGKSQ